MLPLHASATSGKRYEQSGRDYGGDWFASRSVQAQRAEAMAPSRAEVQLLNAEAARGGEAPVVVSSIPAVLTDLRYTDPANRGWRATNVRTGERVTLRPDDAPAISTDLSGSRALTTFQEHLRSQAGYFCARADGGPFLSTLAFHPLGERTGRLPGPGDDRTLTYPPMNPPPLPIATDAVPETSTTPAVDPIISVRNLSPDLRRHPGGARRFLRHFPRSGGRVSSARTARARRRRCASWRPSTSRRSAASRIAGYDVVNFPGAARQVIGWMPDAFGAHEYMTVFEYLDFYARAFGFRKGERAARIAEVMEFTDLAPIAERMMNKLSKGMAQRLCLGRTLLHDPAVLILDEPAAGLDPKARVEFKRLVRLLAEEGKTIFISSHILSELGEMCDTMLFIDAGRIVHHGSAESLQLHSGGQVLYDIHVFGDAAGAGELGGVESGGPNWSTCTNAVRG